MKWSFLSAFVLGFRPKSLFPFPQKISRLGSGLPHCPLPSLQALQHKQPCMYIRLAKENFLRNWGMESWGCTSTVNCVPAKEEEKVIFSARCCQEGLTTPWQMFKQQSTICVKTLLLNIQVIKFVQKPKQQTKQCSDQGKMENAYSTLTLPLNVTTHLGESSWESHLQTLGSGWRRKTRM
jgi:hypothetical protein